MREIRTSGSEGGGATRSPYPYWVAAKRKTKVCGSNNFRLADYQRESVPGSSAPIFLTQRLRGRCLLFRTRFPSLGLSYNSFGGYR
jgi:hypothetical protein